MIAFDVKVCGTWTPVRQGIILSDGKRLAWWGAHSKGIASLSNWRLRESTLKNPIFRAALRDGLSPEEKEQAVARMVGLKAAC